MCDKAFPLPVLWVLHNSMTAALTTHIFVWCHSYRHFAWEFWFPLLVRWRNVLPVKGFPIEKHVSWDQQDTRNCYFNAYIMHVTWQMHVLYASVPTWRERHNATALFLTLPLPWPLCNVWVPSRITFSISLLGHWALIFRFESLITDAKARSCFYWHLFRTWRWFVCLSVNSNIQKKSFTDSDENFRIAQQCY